MRLSTARDKFLEFRKTFKGGTSEATIEAYKSDLNAFIRHVLYRKGREEVRLFTEDQIAAFMAHQAKRGLKAETRARQLSTLRTFAAWGVSRRYWSHDP